MNESLKNPQHLSPQDRKQREMELLHSEPIFDIELSSKCNINCVMCPRTKIRRKLEIMSLTSIKVLIDWLPNNAKAMLCGLGEPLLNKDIFFLISSCNSEFAVSC
jgi:MoaA/NifB/PqqE/SkfB family radical SAM enzyme